MDDCDRHEDEDDCGNEEEGGKTRSRDKIKSRGVKRVRVGKNKFLV